LHNIYFLSAKIAPAAIHTKPTKKTKLFGINPARPKGAGQPATAQGHHLFRIQFGFFIAFAGENAPKKYILCKSSFASSPVIVWQSAHSAVPFSRFRRFHHLLSVSISAGVTFIIGIVAPGFSH
jgi:hypothetical protein